MDEQQNTEDHSPLDDIPVHPEHPARGRKRRAGRKSKYDQHIQRAIESLASFSMPAFAKALLRKFGGEEGLAEKAWEIYKDPDSNAATRRAILDMVFRAFARASEVTEVGVVSDEDLEITAMEILKRIVGRKRKKKPESTNGERRLADT